MAGPREAEAHPDAAAVFEGARSEAELARVPRAGAQDALGPADAAREMGQRAPGSEANSLIDIIGHAPGDLSASTAFKLLL